MATRTMSRPLGNLVAAVLLSACGAPPEPSAEGVDGAESEVVPIGGMYEVQGSTIAVQTGYKREISGTVILAEQGDAYTATFHLTTTYPDPAAEKPLAAEVIGKGEGTIEGRTLRGNAQTQLVVATVPDVDPGFAFIPRSVSTRLQSSTTAVIAADGSVAIEIENRPTAGSDYRPTRTTLRGRRVAAARTAQAEGAASGP